MKAMISLVMSLLLTLGLTSTALANDFAVAVGVRSNSADSDNSTYSVDSKTGFGAGVMGFFDLAPQFRIRSGFMYEQKNVTLTASGLSDIDLNLSYIEIPVTAEWKFADYAGAFVGPVLDLLASKECKISGGGTCLSGKDPQSTMIGWQLGASFKFASQLGAEIFYETVPGTIWDNGIKNGRTVGANLLFTFE